MFARIGYLFVRWLKSFPAPACVLEPSFGSIDWLELSAAASPSLFGSTRLGLTSFRRFARGYSQCLRASPLRGC
jgi:hypothetical protein